MMRTALTVVLLLCAAPALAQNASVPGSLELYPNFNTIGVRLAFSGDANADASAHLEWRAAGASTWIQGLAMTRVTNSRWAASVLWLQPDAAYEVRVVITDPDGGGSTPATAVRTRAAAATLVTGTVYWVATDGSDAAPGTSSQPLATLQAAAGKALPGDAIRVRPGIYYQSVDAPRAGTASALIQLVADAPGVILDGSDPTFLHRTDWQNDGGGVFSVPDTGIARLIVADSLQRLYHQATLADLVAGANGIAQGWTIENGRLSVRLEDGSSPALHVMHLARFNVGVNLDQSWWRVSGFEIRYFGNAAGGMGLYLRAANGCVIDGNYVHHIGGKFVELRVGSSNCLIERNLMVDARIGTWPWAATKAHDEEIAGISNRGGRGNVIRFNTVRGMFDGIDLGDGQTDENVGADCDIHDNTISGVGDDALETDTVSGLNLRVYRNTVSNVFDGLSVSPNYTGPEYVLYNTITGFTRSAFKYSYASSGHTFLYHNTIVGTVSGAPAIWPTGQYFNQHFLNNVFVCTNAPIAGDDGGESQTGNDFDDDLLWTTGPTLFRWKGINYATLTALRLATGFEVGGLSADPIFVAPGVGDYRLTPGSRAVDAGVLIPGINDGFAGRAPDLGAFEGQGGDQIRPAPVRDLR